MWSTTETEKFRQQVAVIKLRLPNMFYEDARLVVGTLVARAFEGNGAMTPELKNLVDEYKRLKPHLAFAMDAFIASRGTTEP